MICRTFRDDWPGTLWPRVAGPASDPITAAVPTINFLRVISCASIVPIAPFSSQNQYLIVVAGRQRYRRSSSNVWSGDHRGGASDHVPPCGTVPNVAVCHISAKLVIRPCGSNAFVNTRRRLGTNLWSTSDSAIWHSLRELVSCPEV